MAVGVAQRSLLPWQPNTASSSSIHDDVMLLGTEHIPLPRAVCSRCQRLDEDVPFYQLP